MSQNAAVASAAAGATPPASPASCFASVTLWHHDDYYLEVNHGYFDTWEEAERFACGDDLKLYAQLGAVFLVAHGREHFIPDGALQIYQTHARQFMPQHMDVDQLLELIDLSDMVRVGIGHAAVERGKPIRIRPLTVQPAANDDY